MASPEGTTFSDHVDYAAKPLPQGWRLMVWDVPDRFGGLLRRLGFLPTKKNPANWWRVFKPENPAEKACAEKCKDDLLAAGLKGTWSRVAMFMRQAEPIRRPNAKPAKLHHGGPKPKPTYGYTDFAQHNTAPGAWRMKKRHR